MELLVYALAGAVVAVLLVPVWFPRAETGTYELACENDRLRFLLEIKEEKIRYLTALKQSHDKYLADMQRMLRNPRLNKRVRRQQRKAAVYRVMGSRPWDGLLCGPDDPLQFRLETSRNGITAFDHKCMMQHLKERPRLP